MAVNTTANETEAINIHVSHGSQRHKVSTHSSNKVGTLKSALHELTGIPCEAQKLIFKGRHLQDDEESIGKVGIKEGSKLMLIGRKVDPAHEEQVKLLDDIRGQADSFQRKVSSVEQELEGVEKGFLNSELVPEKCEKLGKLCLSYNERLMQLLEKLDSVVPMASDVQVRTKRKSIVAHIQMLMARTDQVNERIKTASRTKQN